MATLATNSSALIIPPAPTNAPGAAVADIREIKGPVHIPSGWAWLWWTLGTLLLAFLLWRAWKYWLKRRAKAAAVPEVVIPPHVRAREKLREALALLAQPQPFCVAISDTLRVYLEERFQWHAPERTTEEFLAELQSSDRLNETQKQSLADFLNRCDLVKFARYEPTEAELRDLYSAALQLVDQTEPPPAPPPGELEASTSKPMGAA